MQDLKDKLHLSLLFISHDIAVMRHIADRVAIVYLGKIMEIGPTRELCEAPRHPYTEALLSAVPEVDGTRARIRLEGDIPSVADPPSGCVFHTRCPRFLGDICVNQEPPLAEVEPGHHMRCHIPVDELRRLQAKDAPTPGEPLPTGD